MTATVPPPSNRRTVALALALVAAAPVAWFTHLAISYALVPWSCRIGSDLPLHAATAVALVGLVTCTVLAVRSARRDGRPPVTARLLAERDARRPPGDRDVLTPLAVALAAYFSLVVAMTGLVPIVVDRCA